MMAPGLKRILLAIGFLVLVLVGFARDRGYLDFRTDDEKIRDLTADFLEACADRDMDEVWDLTSEGWHGDMKEVRRNCQVQGIPFPEGLDDEELYEYLTDGEVEVVETLDAPPWSWPGSWLADLSIAGLSFGKFDSAPGRTGDAEVVLRFSGTRYGGLEPGDIRLIVAREGRDWRIDSYELKAFIVPDREPPFPAIRVETPEDARAVVFVRLGLESADPRPEELAATLQAAPPDTLVVFEVAEALTMEDVRPWLEVVAASGREDVGLRPCRQPPLRRSLVTYQIALYSCTVTDMTEHPLDVRIRIPLNSPTPTLLLPMPAGAPPARTTAPRPGDMQFFTVPPEAEPLRDRLAKALADEEPPVPVLAPEPLTSVWKLAAIWRVVKPDTDPAPLLRLPGPEPRLLLRGSK